MNLKSAEFAHGVEKVKEEYLMSDNSRMINILWHVSLWVHRNASLRHLYRKQKYMYVSIEK